MFYSIHFAISTAMGIQWSHMDEIPIKTFSTIYWRLIIRLSFGVLIFWIAIFACEYFFLTENHLQSSLIRSFAISGEMLIGLALFSSALFKWYPRLAVHWRIRRYLGVSGFILIFFHVTTVMQFIFRYDVKRIYYSFNPLINPLIFGTIAYIILFIMTITSTDWMVQRLTPRTWKFIHRFVYIAYISSIFHFIRTNPQALYNPLGYVLYFITALALFGQLFWFFKIAGKKKFRSYGSLVGIIIIILTFILIYVNAQFLV